MLFILQQQLVLLQSFICLSFFFTRHLIHTILPFVNNICSKVKSCIELVAHVAVPGLPLNCLVEVVAPDLLFSLPLVEA